MVSYLSIIATTIACLSVVCLALVAIVVTTMRFGWDRPLRLWEYAVAAVIAVIYIFGVALVLSP
jgi:hypothetical protein